MVGASGFASPRHHEGNHYSDYQPLAMMLIILSLVAAATNELKTNEDEKIENFLIASP